MTRRNIFARWSGLPSRLVHAGTHDYGSPDRLRLAITNLTAYLVAIVSIVYGVVYTVTDFNRFDILVYVNIVHVAMAVAVPAVHRFSPVHGPLLLAGTLYTTVFVLSWQLGHESGMQLFYLVAASASFVTLGLDRKRLIGAILVVGLALHVMVWRWFPTSAPDVAASERLLDNIYTASAITTFVLISLIVFYAFTLARDAEARSERLLLNVLPVTVVDRLKENPSARIADRYEEATVMFADIVDFTEMAHALGAERLVDFLNELFSAFDTLAARHGTEKIKTIGDAYMAVVGIPTVRDDHAQAAAAFAIDILAATHEVGTRLGQRCTIRIGIASGPVTAGVIGTSKFIYDVWGDTVNLAARLQQSGQPGRIHVSSETKTRLAAEHRFVRRDAVPLKGVGHITTWFLVVEDTDETVIVDLSERTSRRT